MIRSGGFIATLTRRGMCWECMKRMYSSDVGGDGMGGWMGIWELNVSLDDLFGFDTNTPI